MISSGKPVKANGPTLRVCGAVGADGPDGADGDADGEDVVVGGVGGTTAGDAVMETATQPLPGGVQFAPVLPPSPGSKAPGSTIAALFTAVVWVIIITRCRVTVCPALRVGIVQIPVTGL